MKVSVYLVFILVFNTVCFAKYETMQSYKKSVQLQKQMSPAYVRGNSDEFIIKFKDINFMDTYRLENRYYFSLSQCIADGICIFKYEGKSDTIQDHIRDVLKNETNIQDILEYKPYDFKAF